jgi:hypothetical protein
MKIFGPWTVVGLGGIGTRILVSLHSDRRTHRQRLNVMAMFRKHLSVSRPPEASPTEPAHRP